MVSIICNPRFTLFPLTLVDMENTLGSRIRKAFELLDEKSGKKHTANWLAVQIGLTRAAVYKWMNNPTAGIEGENLTKAARALQVSSDWLATGRGDMKPAGAPSGGYVVADSIEELVKQIKAKGHDDVLQVIKYLADNSKDQ